MYIVQFRPLELPSPISVIFADSCQSRTASHLMQSPHLHHKDKQTHHITSFSFEFIAGFTCSFIFSNYQVPKMISNNQHFAIYHASLTRFVATRKSGAPHWVKRMQRHRSSLSEQFDQISQTTGKFLSPCHPIVS